MSLDDGFDPAPDRPDALLAMARIAPATTSIGLVATITTTHTEPFHVSKNVATLDLVSLGRAGWRVAVSTSEEAARAVRPQGSPAARRALRRGGRRDRSREPALGQLGGRRRHPRQADRPLPRPRQGALHRLRRPVLQRPRPFDHASLAAGPTARLHRCSRRASRAPRREAGRCRARRRRGATGLPDRGRRAREAPDRAGRRRSPRRGARCDAADGFLIEPDSPATFTWFATDVVPLLGTHAAGATLRDRFGLPRPANRYAS